MVKNRGRLKRLITRVPKFLGEINPTWYAVFLATTIALITLYITVQQYENDVWQSAWNKDPSANVRNIILGTLALSSIPFLILGHLTRRNDIKLKQLDQKMNSDSIIFRELMEELKKNIQGFKDIQERSLKNEKKLAEPEIEHSPSELLQRIRQEVKLIDGNQDDFFTFLDNASERVKKYNSDYWQGYRVLVSMLTSTFNSVNRINNPDLKLMLCTTFYSSFTKNGLSACVLVSMLQTFEKEKIDGKTVVFVKPNMSLFNAIQFVNDKKAMNPFEVSKILSELGYYYDCYFENKFTEDVPF